MTRIGERWRVNIGLYTEKFLRYATHVLLFIVGTLTLLLVYLAITGSTLEPPAKNARPVVQSVEAQVVRGSDDAEEVVAEGWVDLESNDLELTFAEDQQLVGLRFTDVTVPQGAVITGAYVQFQVDENSADRAVLEFRAEATGDAPTFTEDDDNLSTRLLTQAAVTWKPKAWQGIGNRSAAQRTPNLSAVVQEVVNQPSWQTGNALALLISGSGRRTAESFDGDAEGAPLLHVSYRARTASAQPLEAAPTPPTQPAAFPGAEGFGSSTAAGRGGRVMFVTNLNDSGPGSLRAAVEASEPRTVLFRVGGTITLKSRLRLTQPFITIAGQSAPGDGILLRGDGENEPLLEITTHDVAIRYLRFRKGPGGGQDNLTLASTSYDIVIDHNSFSWSTDENINTYRDVRDVTFSWNIIAEPLHCSTHPEGCHGKNGSMGKYSTGSQSFHHNLIMSSHDRSLKLNQSYGVTDYVNNVHYNDYDMTYLHGDYIGNDDRGDFVGLNLVGNWYAHGPDSQQNGVYKPELNIRGAQEEQMKVFVRDNLGPNRPDNALPEWDITDEGKRFQSDTPFAAPVVTTIPAATAYEQVLIGAGATLPRRDAVDLRLVAEVKARTGQWVDDPAEVGGWPTLRSATPASDRDNDGMADAWEQAHGLNPNTPDNAADQDGDGYTNLEAYLAWLAR